MLPARSSARAHTCAASSEASGFSCRDRRTAPVLLMTARRNLALSYWSCWCRFHAFTLAARAGLAAGSPARHTNAASEKKRFMASSFGFGCRPYPPPPSWGRGTSDVGSLLRHRGPRADLADLETQRLIALNHPLRL